MPNNRIEGSSFQEGQKTGERTTPSGLVIENTPFNPNKYRQQFHAFRRPKRDQRIYFDAVGGTQVPDSVVSSMVDYMHNKNGNKGGVFPESVATDETMAQARLAIADFINASTPNEIVFGPSYTENAMRMSRALSRDWNKKPNDHDEIIVTQLDHDANVSPWLLAAEDKGVIVRHADIVDRSTKIDEEDFARLLSPNTRLVAFCAASSSVGTKVDVKHLTEMAHDVGALVYVDAVAYAPHEPIDVQEWNADFVGLSAYKFFGPHVSFLWGKEDLLQKYTPYKIRPAPDTVPDKWQNGAQQYELLAGATAAIDYLAAIGRDHPEYYPNYPHLEGRRLDLKASMAAIKDYEQGLTNRFIQEMQERHEYTLWGVTDPNDGEWRVPTIAVSREGEQSNNIALYLSAEHGINIWSRSVYSKSLSERLGLESTGGFIRAGIVHTNTPEEVDHLVWALDRYRK